MERLKVSSNSEPKLVAGAAASIIRKDGSVELVAVGAAAVNQTVKSIAVAMGYMASEGVEIVFIPTFLQLDILGQEKTGIRFLVEKR